MVALESRLVRMLIHIAYDSLGNVSSPVGLWKSGHNAGST